MSKFLKFSAVALLALATSAPIASARGRAFVGGGVRVYGGGFYPRWGVGFYPGWYGYGPGWYGPWYGPAYQYGPNAGEVEIKTKQKGARIFVDGGYAGLTGQLKNFPLKAGTHEIELRDHDGRTFYQEQINVIAGKKLKIQADYAG